MSFCWLNWDLWGLTMPQLGCPVREPSDLVFPNGMKWFCSQTFWKNPRKLHTSRLPGNQYLKVPLKKQKATVLYFRTMNILRIVVRLVRAMTCIGAHCWACEQGLRFSPHSIRPEEGMLFLQFSQSHQHLTKPCAHRAAPLRVGVSYACTQDRPGWEECPMW